MSDDLGDMETLVILRSLMETWEVMDSEERAMGMKLARKILEASRQEYFAIRQMLQALEERCRQETLSDTDFD